MRWHRRSPRIRRCLLGRSLVGSRPIGTKRFHRIPESPGSEPTATLSRRGSRRYLPSIRRPAVTVSGALPMDLQPLKIDRTEPVRVSRKRKVRWVGPTIALVGAAVLLWIFWGPVLG